MVQYGDSTVYYSRIGNRHLRYPGKLRSRPWSKATNIKYPALAAASITATAPAAAADAAAAAVAPQLSPALVSRAFAVLQAAHAVYESSKLDVLRRPTLVPLVGLW